MAGAKQRIAKTKAKPKMAKVRAKTAVRRKSSTRMLNGIPLKRRMVWVYDLDSPEFEARRKRDLDEIRRRNADRDGMQFVEAVLADPDVQKWWKYGSSAISTASLSVP